MNVLWSNGVANSLGEDVTVQEAVVAFKLTTVWDGVMKIFNTVYFITLQSCCTQPSIKTIRWSLCKIFQAQWQRCRIGFLSEPYAACLCVCSHLVVLHFFFHLTFMFLHLSYRLYCTCQFRINFSINEMFISFQVKLHNLCRPGKKFEETDYSFKCRIFISALNLPPFRIFINV